MRYVVARSGTKLEKTSLNAGGSIVPAYDIVYIAQLDLENTDFHNYLIHNLGTSAYAEAPWGRRLKKFSPARSCKNVGT